MTLDTFEQSLLAELRQDVAARAARRTTRRRWAWAAIPVAGAGAVAAVLALASSPAAFAIEQTGNGSVVVTIHDLGDPDGLTQALAAKGVHADVRWDAHFAQTPGRSRQTAGTGGTSCDIRLAKVDGGLRFTLGAAQIARGSELEIITSGSSPDDVGSPVAVYWSGAGC